MLLPMTVSHKLVSQASSISVARATEAVRIAELQAEVHALKQRQLIHETELRLKKEELDLQFKKDQLKLETEFKKAVARESVYAKADRSPLAFLTWIRARRLFLMVFLEI